MDEIDADQSTVANYRICDTDVLTIIMITLQYPKKYFLVKNV